MIYILDKGEDHPPDQDRYALVIAPTTDRKPIDGWSVKWSGDDIHAARVYITNLRNLETARATH